LKLLFVWYWTEAPIKQFNTEDV
jgi:hypothetical protein